MKRRNQEKLGLFCLLAALMLLTSCKSGGLGSPEAKFEKQIQGGQYLDAIETYTSSIMGNANLEVEAGGFLKQYLGDAWNGYLEETVGQKEFEAMLQTVQNVDEKANILGWDLRVIQADYPVIAASKEAYQEAVQQMTAGDYDDAMDSFLDVSPLDEKNFQTAQNQYQEAKKKYIETVVQAAKESLDARNYDAAWENLSVAEQTIGWQQEFEDLKTVIETSRFEEEMRKSAEKDDFNAMSRLYQAALENEHCEISGEMSTLFAQTAQTFRQGIIDRSIAAYKEKGYEAAIPVISEGLAVLPEDEKLMKYEALYKSCIPVKLNELSTTSQSRRWDEASMQVSNAYGDVFSGDIVEFFSYDTTNTTEYVLNRNYTNLSTVCFMTGSYHEFQINIYLDDVNVFSSEIKDETTDPIEINLNVQNVRLLKIEVTPDRQKWDGYGYLYFSNTQIDRVLSDAELNNP